MEWHPDWKKILLKAYSQRFTALAVLASGLEVYFAIYGAPAFIPLGTFAAISALTSAAAFYFKLKAQKEFKDAD
jgi:hypothetical protein